MRFYKKFLLFRIPSGSYLKFVPSGKFEKTFISGDRLFLLFAEEFESTKKNGVFKLLPHSTWELHEKETEEVISNKKMEIIFTPPSGEKVLVLKIGNTGPYNVYDVLDRFNFGYGEEQSNS